MGVQTRDLPPKSHSFSPLAAAETPDLCPTSARVTDQTVERDWRQAMPRAGPALSRAPLPLSAVVGAATLRGRQSAPPSRYSWESPGAGLALLRARCHDTSRSHDP